MQGHVCDTQLMSSTQCTYPSARIMSPLLSNFSLHVIAIGGLYKCWRRVILKRRVLWCQKNVFLLLNTCISLMSMTYIKTEQSLYIRL